MTVVDSAGDRLAAACKAGDLDALRALLDDGLDPNELPVRGMRPLTRVLQYDRVAMLELLLARGADPNAPGLSNTTPLMRAQSAEAARALLQAGADPNAATTADVDVPRCRAGTTPLMLAAGSGRIGVVEQLLLHGADHRPRDQTGHNALMLAALRGHTDIVQALARAGAEIGLVEAATLRDAEIVRQQLAAEPGPDPREIDRSLWWAAERGSAEVIWVLADAGADVNKGDSNGVPALLWAARGGHIEALRVLLERGARVEVGADPDTFGTPLLAYLTFDGRDPEGVRLLLDHGADPNQRGRNALIPGWSPLMLAAIHGNV